MVYQHRLKAIHWVTAKSGSDLTMFLQAMGEQPSARVVNATEASLSKYIQVRAISFKEKGLQSLLHRQSNNIIHGGSVKGIKK